MNAPARHITWHPCHHCQKRSYATRKAAKRVLRYLRDRDHGRRVYPYRCPAGDGWHVGHIPTAVKTGHTPRQEYR